MPETKQVDNSLSTFQKTLADKLTEKQKYAQGKLDEYTQLKEANRLSPEETKQREDELMQLDSESQKTTMEAEEKLGMKKQELLEPIRARIQEKINEIAREGNFTYILIQTGNNNILYGLETMNITKTLASRFGISLE
jgi:outer membrane protein